MKEFKRQLSSSANELELNTEKDRRRVGGGARDRSSHGSGARRRVNHENTAFDWANREGRSAVADKHCEGNTRVYCVLKVYSSISFRALVFCNEN